MSNDHNNDTGKYLIESIRLAMGNVKGRKQATWPFGAVLVKDGRVLARAVNQVDELCDPSAHAEMQAVRLAAKAQGSYAYSNEDGEPYDLSAARGYEQLARPEGEREMALVSHRVRDDGEDLYDAWQKAVSAA